MGKGSGQEEWETSGSGWCWPGVLPKGMVRWGWPPLLFQPVRFSPPARQPPAEEAEGKVTGSVLPDRVQ